MHQLSCGIVIVLVVGDPRQAHLINISAGVAEPASDTASYFNIPAGLFFVLATHLGDSKREKGHTEGCHIRSTLLTSNT